MTTIFSAGAEQNRALEVWSMIGGIGATVGLLVGGAVTDALGWRWIYFLNLPIGVVVLALTPALVRPDDASIRAATTRGADVTGAVTITAALVALVYALTQGPRAGWTSAQTLAPLSTSVGLVVAFAVVQARVSAPMLPLHILRHRGLILGNVIMLVAGAAVDGMLYILTLYTQRVLG